jgi:hypothetical protein
VPVWQSTYETLNDPGFEIISAAQDTGGEAAAGWIFDEAGAKYVQILDVDHRISALFHFVNVPSAAWIDEQGRVVRLDEGAYAKKHFFGGTDAYTPAVVDWVRRGAQSRYVRSARPVSETLRVLSADELRAAPAFRLGNHFREIGRPDKADAYWKLAQQLQPDSINFFRQDLSFTEEGSAGETFRARAAEMAKRGEPYYRPLDLGEPAEQ